ncbi:tetratricopeptide repeat protein [Caldimonas tepidiphila]|uniref:tetratricopeptide repeat protein n=1 Tax=Caldimonas tepidiphila TaxID=2315841 RepID=UPI0013006C7C|nr:hypothetical protein [Caldimonas tepidiphila]
MSRLVVGLAVAAAFPASLLLVPSGGELAALRLETGHPEEARRILESRRAAGDRSAVHTEMLARVRARQGDLPGSIGLLEELAAARPQDTSVLESLARLYHEADRTEDHAGALERLQDRQPTVERQRQLVTLQGELGRPAQQLAALAALIDRFDAGDVADFLLLARLQAEQGRPRDALATYRKLAGRHPQALDASIVAAEMRLRLDTRDAEGALERGRGWLAARPGELSQAAPMLAAALAMGGRADLAVALLEPFAGGPAPAAPVLAASIQVLVDAGRLEDAVHRVETLPPTATSTPELQHLRLRVALAAGRTGLALDVARGIGLDRLPPELLADVLSAALAARRQDVLDLADTSLRTRLASGDPLLAARTALALGDAAGARRWSAAAARAGMPPGRWLELAGVLQQLGDTDGTLQWLRRAADAPDAKAAPGDIARLYLALGRAEEGRDRLERLRREAPSPAADEAWALLATVSGRHAQVATWLDGEAAQDRPAGLYRDLYHLAMQARAHPLAVRAAERLQAVARSDSDRLLLAEALIASGRAGDALRQLRGLAHRGPLDADRRFALLLAAWRQGEPVADELRRACLERLGDTRRGADPGPEIATLFELRAHGDLVPLLEPLAAREPGRWLGAFAEAATASDQKPRLLALWTKLGLSGTVPPELRLQLAHGLLDAGKRAPAERILRLLAADAPREAPVVRQLLFVWGPRPTAEQLDWLAARARQARPAERAGWMRDLVERGAAARAVEVYRASARQDPGPEPLDAYLEALAALGDPAQLAGALREIAAAPPPGAPLARLARQARQLGDPALERRLLERALAEDGSDPALQRDLGLLAYRQRDAAAAQRYLEAFVARTGGDAETHRTLGELRLQRGETESARRSFRAALAALERPVAPGHDADALRASLLHRLGRHDEAIRQYEALLAGRPQDAHLRADYVAMLLELGETRRAHLLLSAR